MNSISPRKPSMWNRFVLHRSTALSISVLASVVLLSAVPALAYPQVRLTNLTQWSANGEVNYAACRNDKFTGLKPGDTWSPSARRGACLITWIRVTLTGGPPVTQYSSSGTSYSEFFISPSGPGYQVFSSHEAPTASRAQPGIKPQFFNIAHMVNTAQAVDWALSQGANSLEMDLRFFSDGVPLEFKHGGICDCICTSGDNVCRHLRGGCEAVSSIPGLLNHIATKAAQVAMIVLDSKVDDPSLSEPAQKVAGARVVQVLEQELFAKGYRGIVLVSAPKSAYFPYLLAAVGQANQSTYKDQIYFGVDMDNGDVDGARRTLENLWRNLGSPLSIYGSGISACAAGTFYGETMLAGWYQSQGRIRLVNIWTLDKTDSMKKYIWLGARGVMTNKPGDLDGVARGLGMTLAQPGYRP